MKTTFKIWETNRKLHFEFLEKYTLGEIMYEIKYKKYFFIRNECKKYINDYLNENDNVYLLSEIVFQIKDKYLLIKDDVYESKFI